jgi:hypothetical protein
MSAPLDPKRLACDGYKREARKQLIFHQLIGREKWRPRDVLPGIALLQGELR